MVDFLINYEHKARELDAICLIKAELERRGYSVEFSCTYDEDRVAFAQRKQAKVVVAPALYNDACLYGFVYSIAGYCRKVVNLQWEQSLTNQDESDPSFYQNPKESAIDALHFCWGDEPRNRLLRAGVRADRAVVVGPVQMDTLRPEFNAYYSGKAELARRYNLDAAKDWVLFISSFTFVNMTEEEYATEVRCMGERLHDFREISIMSKQHIIHWLELAIAKFPNKLFIYRPHPSENEDPSLLEIENKYTNFRIIQDLSVKQWIKCSDKILTWYSTAAAEVFYGNKTLTILRPVYIPYEWEVTTYRNAAVINDCGHFIDDLENTDSRFPLDESLIRDYYQVQSATPSYMRACDVLEKVYNSDDYDMLNQRPLIMGMKISLLRFRLRFNFILKELIAAINYRKMFFNNKFVVRKIETHLAIMSRLSRDRWKNKADETELRETLSKIQGVVNGVKSG